MLNYIVKTGATSVILDIFIGDSTLTATTLGGLTGLLFNTGSLTCYYHRNTAASAVAVSLVTMTAGTFTSLGFVEVDGANMPGMYQLCLPNAAFNSGATQVSVVLKGAAGMVQTTFTIRLTAADLDNATTLGLTNLDATVSSRLAPTVAARTLDVTATGGAGIDWANVENPTTSLALTGTSIASSPATLSSSERNAVADALLDRNMATGTDSGSPTVRTPRQALRFLRNKMTVAATVLTVYKEDDTTTSWTAAVTTDVAALPITGVDPA